MCSGSVTSRRGWRDGDCEIIDKSTRHEGIALSRSQIGAIPGDIRTGFCTRSGFLKVKESTSRTLSPIIGLTGVLEVLMWMST